MAPSHTIDVGPLVGPGRRTITVDTAVGVPDFDELRFAEPARVALELTAVERGIRIAGTIDADATALCLRCLEEVAVPLHVDVDERIAVDDQGDPFAESNVLLGERLDLSDLVRQLTATALPMIGVLCSEECRGLCPQCGRNRNEDGCTCPPEMESE